MAKDNWTGERLELFINGEVTIEHLHRYATVLNLVRDKVVLDIACGEGYGSNLMADYAKRVIGVDIADKVISEASQKYCKSNLSFVVGDATQIPLPDNSVEVIISFETLEHHTKHQEMFKEIIRVLKHDGFMIMSSPDKKTVMDYCKGYVNIYHVKELTTQEFKSLVESYFSNVTYYKQKTVIGSLIVPEDGVGEFQSFSGTFDKIQFQKGLCNGLYNLCLASNTATFSLPSGFFDGGKIILESSYKQRLRKTAFYRYGYPFIYILVRLKKIINRLSINNIN
jgi:ubiquinone/menaquinone biosynthesis C-methylase UbiE